MSTVMSNFGQSFKKQLASIAILAVLVSGLQFVDIGLASPAQANAPDPISGFCRSDGTGLTEEISHANNGFYISNSSRAGDAVTGLRLNPLFAKRMYVDFSKNFDATYIAYQLVNNTGAAINNLQIVLSGFEGTQISPVSSADLTASLSIPAGESATAYFMVRARSITGHDQQHEVRVFSSAGVQQLGCKTNIKGIQRSISAQANKVTAISVSTSTPSLGQTFTVTVTGAPGRIGAGSDPDRSVIAMSPATNSLWPTKALRLERVSFALRGFNGNSTSSACQSLGAVFDNPSKTATWTNTLVIRSFSTCADTNKHTYVATYTFRLVGFAATNPVIRPLSSISSGAQIKYTGSLPSVDVVIPLTNSVKPNVVKSYVGCSSQPETVQVSYRVTVSAPEGASSESMAIDKIRDIPATAGEFVSAAYTDASVTAVVITKSDVLDGDKTYWDFAPANKFSLSKSKNVVLDYVVKYPKPASGSSSHTNRAVAYYGDVIVASGDVITGIKTDISSDGACLAERDDTTVDKTPQQITFDPPTPLGSGTNTEIKAYSDSGLPVTLTSLTTAACTVSLFNGVDSVFTISEGEDCIIQATQGGDTTFEAASPVSKTIQILKGQVITHTAGIFGNNSTTTVQVQATSKLKVLLTSIDISVCTVAGTEAVAYNSSTGSTTYTINKIGTATGSCVLNATQDGGTVTVDAETENWGPAPSKDIIIGVGLAQYIDFSGPAAGTSYIHPTNASFSAVATARKSSDNTASGLPVYFSSNSPTVCALAASSGATDSSGFNSSTGATTVTINILGPGTCDLRANQDGLKDDGTDSGFASAAEVAKTISVVGDGNNDQVLEITSPGSKTYGDADLVVEASSKKPPAEGGALTGLMVALTTSTPTVCQLGTSSLAGNLTQTPLKMLSAGSCVLIGNQAGNSTYKKATEVSITFAIGVKSLTVDGLSATRQYDGTTSVSFTGTARLSGVVTGDGIAEIALSGSASGSYPDAIPEESKAIPVGGFSVTGSKASSYDLQPLTLNGSITKRIISVKFLDVTVNRTSDPSCGLSAVAISVGSIAESEELFSISCSAFPTKVEGNMPNGEYSITPQSATIKRGASEVSDYYQISYLAGTLKVTGKKVPEIVADSVTIIYGTADTSLESSPKAVDTAGGVKAKDKENNSLLTGSLNYKFSNGNPVGKTLAVGTHNLTVVFTPSLGDDYDTAEGTRTVIVKPRRLTITGLSAQSKVYDGSRSATVNGTATLAADPATGANPESEGYGFGVLAEDQADLSLAGTPTVEFSSADAGDSISISYSGRSLSGAKAGNYILKSSLSFTAGISRRKLSVDLENYQKLYDGTNSLSTLNASLVALPLSEGGDGGGVVPGDDVEIDLDASGADVITAILSSADAGSEIPLTLSGGKLRGAKSGNYDLLGRTGLKGTIVPRKLTIAGLSPQPKTYDGTRIATVSQTGSQLLALDPALGGNVSCDVSVASCGVITEDTGRVELAGTASYEFDSPNVGVSKAISFGGQFLSGDKKHNYELVEPSSLTATIVPRPITLRTVSISKILGTADPVLSYEVVPKGPHTGFASGENAATIGISGITRMGDETVGNHKIKLSYPAQGVSEARDNYEIIVEEGELFIASVVIEVDELEVTCSCQGLKPGTEVNLILRSDPTTLDTGRVGDDGECPLLKGSIPPDTEGEHEVYLEGSFPNDDELSYFIPLSFNSNGSQTVMGSGVTGGYLITLHYPKGMSGPKQLVYPSGAASLELPILSRKGLLFKGWSEKQIARKGKKALKGVNRNMDLYSVWQLLPLKNAVYFGPDSPVLTNQTKSRLSGILRTMRRQGQSAILIVDGWVKKTPDTSYSMQLSSDRAKNVANFLRAKGAKVWVRTITPKGVFPRVTNKARKAELRIFFSGSFQNLKNANKD